MVRVFSAQLGCPRFDLCPTNPSVTVSFGQKHRWEMRVSTISTLDRTDFDRIFQQINLNLSTKAIRTSEPRGNWRLRFQNPSLQRIFGNPLPTFRQSFASRFLQNQDFSCYDDISVPITRGPLRCLLGVWSSGPKPCGGIQRSNFLDWHLPSNHDAQIVKSVRYHAWQRGRKTACLKFGKPWKNLVDLKIPGRTCLRELVTDFFAK